MKKIIIALFLLPLFCGAQTLTIKLASPKTIVVVPAQTVTTDSVIVNEFIDNGTSLSALLTFYVPGSGINPQTKRITLWEGAEYIANKDYTKTQLKARIKTLLTQ